MKHLSNKPDVTLVNFIFRSRHTCVPTGSLGLVAILRKQGFSVDFRDFQLVEPQKFNNISAWTSFFSDTADILAVSCFSHTLPYLIEIVSLLKKKSPGKKIILGGVGPSVVAKVLLDTFDCIDVIVLGKEYETLPKLLTALRNKPVVLDGIGNIAYKEDEEIVVRKGNTKKPTEYQDLIPELEKIDLKPYRMFPLVLARGCPFKCRFCCIPSYMPNYEKRDLELVKGELQYLANRLNERMLVYLVDEAFLANRNHTAAILKIIGHKKYGELFHFVCDGRIDYMSEQLLKNLKNNNISTILYGMDSGSDRIIKKLGKNHTIKQAVEIVRLSKKYLNTVLASFIYGFPFETYDEFLDTIYYALYLSSLEVNVFLHLVCPLPGTALYQRYHQRLIFSRALKSNYNTVKTLKKTPEFVLDLVAKFPTLFATYSHYETPDLVRKHIIAENYRPVLRRQFNY